MRPIERAGYLAHAKSNTFRRRIEEARGLIGAHPEHAVCVSWGKDSLVLYDLCRERPAVHGRYHDEERFPDLDAVRDAFSPGAGYSEVGVPGAWDMFERAGGFFLEPSTAKQREASRWYHREWAARMLEATGGKVLLGIRREESSNRFRLVAMRGRAYETKTHESVVLPLASWTGSDVWAYIASHNLPYPRIYDAAFSGRARARSDFTFGAGVASDAIRRHGAWQDWKRAYPEAFAAWAERWPEIGALA